MSALDRRVRLPAPRRIGRGARRWDPDDSIEPDEREAPPPDGDAPAQSGSRDVHRAAETSAAADRAPNAPIILLESVSRIYDTGRVQVSALVNVNLEVRRGEFVAIVGPSGSGKSTMMNILGCLDRPSAGRYVLDGTPVEELDDDGLAELRSRRIGFVFQSYNLLPRTSALENVATPLMYQGVARRDRLERAKTMLERLGLGDRLHHEPSELSGGQQQRVGIARALVTEPAIILADEPTGNLDTHSGAEVLQILRDLNETGSTIVLITHDPDVAAAADRQIHLRDGAIVSMEEVAA